MLRNRSACLGATPSVIGYSQETKSGHYGNPPEMITEPGGPPRAKNTTQDGWGQPQMWLETAQASFAAHGIDALAARSAELLGGPRPGRWTGLGVTAREADVLVLVAEGLANKQIAARLHVSPRTVEKHVESLLRKAGARSRTQLVAIAGPSKTPSGSENS